MTSAWIDASAGASGDMLLGALLDAGASLERVRIAVAAVGVEPVGVRTEVVRRGGLRALRAHVDVPDAATSRRWRDVRALLDAADLPEPVRETAVRTFTLLAEAEAHVHGIGVDEVHFHEVGALDAIADVVGVCAAVHDLGLRALTCSVVTVGSGRVGGAHGRLPVPVPAVAELLARAGLPSVAGPVEHEACTPTGAALLAALATGSGGQPAMVVRRIGVGAGGRDTADGPNIARILIGDPVLVEPVEADGARSSVEVVLATNVDDLDPRLWPGVLDALLAAGAADAWLTPVLMKKGRPAHTLHVLARPDRLDDVRRIVLTHTSAIGLREHTVAKHALARETAAVDVRGERVRVKLALLGAEVVNVQPELDDVVAAAAALDLPAKVVLAEASAAALTLLEGRVP